MKNKSIFGKMYSPYKNGDKSTMKEWYEEYKNDPKKVITVNDQVFYRIIHRCEFYLKKENTLLVVFEPEETVRINDVLVDEEGGEFTVKCFEHFHYSPIPEWYPSVINACIIGESYNIGEYLSIKRIRPYQ